MNPGRSCGPTVSPAPTTQTFSSFAVQLGLPPLNCQTNRIMLCGSPSILAETRGILDEMGFEISPKTGVPGDYVIKRAFVE